MGAEIEATVLYADMADSTHLVDNYYPKFAAEVYKAFLYGSAKIIRSKNGEITAYDGDRIMAVFMGSMKNTHAAEAGLKINDLCKNIINPAIKAQYPKTSYTLKHVVGIDTSPILVAKIGMRTAGDLVWVGRAANHAAKLSALSSEYPTRITQDVYNSMNDSSKVSTTGKNMWEEADWTNTGRKIYKSVWTWKI